MIYVIIFDISLLSTALRCDDLVHLRFWDDLRSTEIFDSSCIQIAALLLFVNFVDVIWMCANAYALIESMIQLSS